MDVLFISPGNASEIYQDLASDYSSIEPPTWALLLAESCRSKGHEVGILDINAEKIKNQNAIEKIKAASPRLICFVVYGQNVNAGTVSMSGAVSLANDIKKASILSPIAFIGSHVQALPQKTLEEEESIDVIFTNEGVYALQNLLKRDSFNTSNLESIKGIGFRKNGKPFFTMPEKLVPNDQLDFELPGYAWDLLPYKERPLDLYRSPMWHANYNQENRTPYATLYSSLGCKFGCDFCMINIINRVDNDEVGVASNYRVMRHWSPSFVVKQIDKLVEMGVYTLRFSDEMFLLNPKYYIPIIEELAEKDYADKLLIWAYSRIDTVARNPETLKLLRKAGIRWLALGIESGNKKIRLEVSKGKFENLNIYDVIKSVHDADIEIIGNYLFGLPEDDLDSMQETLDLSLELCTSGWNAYAVMPIPGSKLYKDALENGYELPSDYTGYSFHAYNTKPMPTKHLSPAEVLKFRDEAFNSYHSSQEFLKRIKKKFGDKEVENIKEMTKVRLKRKILGH